MLNLHTQPEFPFAHKNLVSRDRFGRSVRHQRAHPSHSSLNPRSRLTIWSRETGSAVPFSVSVLNLHTQPESPFTPENLVSRDRFGRLVPRQRARSTLSLNPRSRLRIWSRETGSTVPSRVSVLNLLFQPEFPFAPENLVSRNRFGRPVRRQCDHSPLSACILVCA